jgi:hypothetical protein
MSYTFTRESTKKGGDVEGSLRTVWGVVVADAVSGIIAPGALGLKYIVGGAVVNKSATTAGYKVVWNAATASAATNGYVNIANVTSGDELYLQVYGR